jgi:acetyl esterase/lipase
MKFLQIGISFLLFVFSLLNWFASPYVWMWKASILSKEFGIWFAISSLLILVWFAMRPMHYRRLAVLLLVFAFIGFLQPWYFAFAQEKEWALELGSDQSLLSWKILLLGRGESAVPPEHLVYATVEQKPLTLDYYPAQSLANHAWVLIIHGGGWDSGDAEQLPDLNSHLANQGYAVFSINYRLAPQDQWPKQKQDVNAAIAYIQTNAERWKLDAKRWAVLGRSAGAQIAGASTYAMSVDSPRAVVLLYGPTDMVFAYDAGDEDDILHSRALVRNFLGGPPPSNLSNYQDASPLDQLSNKTPPTLLMHGRSDTLVWYKHSERLYARLQNLKVPSVLILMPWATHGFDYSLNGPAGQISTKAVEIFLKKYLL